ncbi:GntR family transcriptional regulator [Streptomyces sp. NPDC058373]|uniref:GntR family transcriptional regulator n=1 Tax=Streptomyces sp. NPDC058373 TaxID=3346465 RepID=UPI00364658CF
MITFQIERRSGVATYMQIVLQTKQALRLGVLVPGDKLPTAKEVVQTAAINPHTVLKAYRELEREGLVELQPGRGTFVRRGLGTPDATSDAPLRAELTAWLRKAEEAGLDAEDVTALFDACRAEVYTAAGSATRTGPKQH